MKDMVTYLRISYKKGMAYVKKYSVMVLLIAGCTIFSGCSLMKMYVIRNCSSSLLSIEIRIPDSVERKINGTSGHELVPEIFHIKAADRIIPLKKREIKSAFSKNIPVQRLRKGIYQFGIPGGCSAEITGLINLTNNDARNFQHCTISIKSGNTILSFGNGLSEIHSIFKSRSFSMGPVVYYLDLK